MIDTTIDTIFWDFGGVFTDSPFLAFNRFEHDNGLPADFIRQLNSTNPDQNAWARFERSSISLAEFDRQFAAESRAAGHEIAGNQVLALLYGELRPAMATALRCCQGRLKNVCVTNNFRYGPGPEADLLRSRARIFDDLKALFDTILESSHLGVRKPDPEFYRMACKQLNVRPTQVAYLDDLGINLKPARALGMTTIKVVDGDAAISQLEQLVGFSLRSLH